MKQMVTKIGMLLSTVALHAESRDLDTPVVTANQYMEYKRSNGLMKDFAVPKVVLVCYQQFLLDTLVSQNPDIKLTESFSTLYLVPDTEVGILGGWGIGAPALANKMEQLVALGVKKFVAIGFAGTLCDDHDFGDFVLSPSALAEDGVSHLYLPPGEKFANAHPNMLSAWNDFASKESLPPFHTIPTWSFSVLYRETPRAIRNATSLGCGVVEMEAATLYAIGAEKGVETISLFVISDSVTEEKWTPHIKEPAVKENLVKLALWALKFSKSL